MGVGVITNKIHQLHSCPLIHSHYILLFLLPNTQLIDYNKKMVDILTGARFNSFHQSRHVDHRNNRMLQFHFSRKIFAVKPSNGSRVPSLTVDASEKRLSAISEQELTTAKEKSYSLTLLRHTGNRRLLDEERKKQATLLDQRLQNAPSLSYMKFMAMCGFFTLQTTQQALAGGSELSFSFLGDLGDISTGFASAFLLIFFSELGDKTFFIAALLAARNSPVVTFIGTFGALGVMTVISVVVGRTFHYVDDILPFRLGDADLPLDDLAAVCLLVYFGVSSLLDASSGDGLKAEEEQKEAELAVSEVSGGSGAGILSAANTVFSTFLLVFVAEWGDKSFFSTIALAAASSPLGVITGALAGHGVATLLAVLGGSFLGSYLSEKVISYIGGTLFLVFAAVTLVEIIS